MGLGGTLKILVEGSEFSGSGCGIGMMYTWKVQLPVL